MSGVGRWTLTRPLLPRAESVAQAVVAHLNRFWALWLSLLLTWIAAAVGLYTGLDRLATRWNYPYDHWWLVLGMSAWLLLRNAQRANIEQVGPSSLGLGALAVTVLLYALSEVLDLSLGMHLTLPLMLLALVAALAGPRFARVAVVPLAMSYFAIPIWDLTIPLLQKITVAVVAALVSWTGPPAYTVGNLITIPAGSFEIAEGCSGMRYFMVSLAITAFIGLSWYERWRTRVWLLAVAGLAAMTSNWIRIYTLILIGDATDMQHYVIAKSHDGYGWLVYVVCLLPVLWFARLLDTRELRAPAAAPYAPPAAHVARPEHFLLAGVLAAALLLSPVLIRMGSADARIPGETAILPNGGSGWVPAMASDSWEPHFEAPHFETHEAVKSARGIQVELFVARYLRQKPGSKLVNTHNRVSPEWQVTASSPRPVTAGHGSHEVLQTTISRGSETRLVWQWYMVGGKPVHARARAKLLELAALLRGRRDGGAIAISALCAADCAKAEEAMAELLMVAGGRLEALASGAADGAPVP